MNRERKWRLFLATQQPTPETLVLDVGFSNREYSSVDNYIEKRYPHPERLTALGIEEPDEFALRYPDVETVRYDGLRFPFDDKQFDICWSNAVLEHVGGRERQVQFLSEIRRVSKRAFVTTPNRLFPVEVHTRTPILHYLPPALFDRYLRRTGKAWATSDHIQLLSETELRQRLSSAGFSDYRIVRNRFFGLTIDFVVIAAGG